MDGGYKTLMTSQELKRRHKRHHSKDDIELEAAMRRIEARFLALPASFWSNGRRQPCARNDWILLEIHE